MNVEFSNDSTSNFYIWMELHPEFKKIVRRDCYLKGVKKLLDWAYEMWKDTEPPAGIVLSEIEWLEIYSVWKEEAKTLLDEVEKKLDYKLFKKWHEC
jgi:hypothetical protein